MAFKFLAALIFSTTAFAQLRTTDFQQSLNASAPRNYVVNSGAEKNDLNVTDAGGIVSRTTTTPLEGVGSFVIDAASSTQKAIFTAGDLQDGLLGQSCEATANYIGDGTLYKAYVTLAGTTVSTEVTLLNSGSNTQAISIIFPCGASTTADPAFVIEATGNGASIEVDSVYLGKALNIGSVAQAQVVVRAVRVAPAQSIGAATPVQVVFNSESIDAFAQYSTSTGAFTSSRTARLLITGNIETAAVTANETVLLIAQKNGANQCVGYNNGISVGTPPVALTGCIIDVVPGDTIGLFVDSAADTAYNIESTATSLTIEEIPNVSQLVVRGDVTNVMVTAAGLPTGPRDGTGATIWGTESRDTTSSYDNTTGAFTAPISGDYCWAAQVGVSGTGAANSRTLLDAYVDGTILGRGTGMFRYEASPTGQYNALSAHCTFLNRAQVLTFRTSSNITTPIFSESNAGVNYLTIWNSSGGVPKPFIPSSIFWDDAVTQGGESGTNTIESGATVPTLVTGTNIAAVGTAACIYQRIGTRVNASCRVPVTCTTASATNSNFQVPLPVASNLASANDVIGTYSANIVATTDVEGGAVIGDSATDRAVVAFRCQSTGSLLERYINFSYTVQ